MKGPKFPNRPFDLACIEALDRAAQEPFGVRVETNDPSRLRHHVYLVRRHFLSRGLKPEWANLSLYTTLNVPNTVFILNRGV